WASPIVSSRARARKRWAGWCGPGGGTWTRTQGTIPTCRTSAGSSKRPRAATAEAVPSRGWDLMQPNSCLSERSALPWATRRLPMTSTDRIEKKIVLRAPRARVWRALTDAAEFGTWFRVKLDGGFEAGRRITGRVTYPGYEHVAFEATVETMDAERLFSLRWH